MIKLRTILLYDYLYLIITIIVLLYSLLFTNLCYYQSNYTIDDTVIIGYIDKVDIDGSQLKMEVYGKEKIIVNYQFKTESEKLNFDFNLGDKIKAEGEMIEPPINRVFNLFNYQKYLYRNKIHYLFNANNIKKIENNKKLKYKIKQAIINRINKIEKSKHYLKTFILGNTKEINKDIYKSYQINGVNHLLAISGMHIAFLSLSLIIILKKLKIEEVKRYIIVIIFLFFYMFLTNYIPSVLRATLFFCLLSINNIYYFHIKTINILLLTLSILLLFNPYLIYSISFQYSFIVSFYLILFQSLINKGKNYITKTFIVSLIAFLAGFPLSIYYFYQINIFSSLINIIFVPLITLILFPLSLITFILPIFDSFFAFLVNIMEQLSLMIMKIDFGVLILAKPNIILVIVYYAVITMILYKWQFNHYRYILLLILLILVHYNNNYFNINPYLVFIDVGQGDCIFINLPFNKGSLLIDTGGKDEYEKEKWQIKNNQYSIGRDMIIPYLKSLGIKKLDYLILTHNHSDHMGESFDIINYFKVKKVIMNDSYLSLLKDKIIKKQISYDLVKAGNIINLNNYLFFILNPINNLNDENDKSIVIYTILNNQKILLVGDISSKIELKLLDTYNLYNMDILKIGHHGSITSSSEKFLDILKPKYAVIQVGLNNKFNHPDKEIINRLNHRNIKTFLTSINGSIRFDLKNNGVTIKTILP